MSQIRVNNSLRKSERLVTFCGREPEGGKRRHRNWRQRHPGYWTYCFELEEIVILRIFNDES